MFRKKLAFTLFGLMGQVCCLFLYEAASHPGNEDRFRFSIILTVHEVRRDLSEFVKKRKFTFHHNTSLTWRLNVNHRFRKTKLHGTQDWYRGTDKSLARPTSQCILFDGENISFDASLVTYINSTNFPPIMIINRIYEHQNLLSL